MSLLPRKEAIELVRQRRGIDLLTRSVLTHMLHATRDTLMLFWQSELRLAADLEVSHRTMQRIFHRLRLAGLIVQTVWPAHLAGARRTQAKSYSIQITPEGLARLQTPAEYLSSQRSKRAVTTSRWPDGHHVTVAESPRHGDVGHHVTVADDSKRQPRLEETERGDRPPPTPPPTPASENPREALRAALHVLTGGRRLDEGATEEWWSMLTGDWRVPPKGWAIEATIDWIRSKVTRLGYAREAVGLQSWWIDFDRGGVLNQASPGRRREMAVAGR